MPTLKGKKAELLHEGCKLNKKKKIIEARLKKIKKEIKLKATGTYRNPQGDELNIVETEKFTDISPRDVIDYLKSKGMSSRFPEVIKVQLTPLKKVVPESMIDKWRFPLDSIMRWSWK